MPTNDYSKNIVYLSKEQYQELITNETLTVNGQTITYNDNDIYVTPQAEPITDVKINGTSIGSNGVANIPKASTSNLGLVKVNTSFGIGISNAGDMMIATSTDGITKNGVSQYYANTPYRQHMATFYGLAKAAGADMASIASTTVGIYPDAQKAAIQNMLGITDLISTEESSTATAAHALNSTFMMNGKLHRATAVIAIGDAVEVGTNCEVVKADEVFVKKTDIATNTTAGLIKVSPTYGLRLSSGTIVINETTSSTIKSGTWPYAVISPEKQHESVFYGLSKIAGVDLANETVTLGTYPETSKTAIRSLIGAAAIGDLSNKEDKTVVVTITRTQNQENTTYTADKTFAEIVAAIEAGKTVIATMENYGWHIYYKLADYGISEAIPGDSFIRFSHESGQDAIYLNIKYNNTVEYSSTVLSVLQSIAINGTDIIPNDHTANIPLASNDTFGVVKTGGYGVRINNDGVLYINPATISTEVKPGAANYLPIVPSTQHAAVFYGLSKVAGVDLANETVTLGTYPNTSKVAIRNMLGATSSNVIAVQDEQPTDSDTKVWLPETEAQGIQVPTMEDMANYVQKTDYADTTNYGIVKPGNRLTISNGIINVASSSENSIKTSITDVSFITPVHQHEATFYGLAKAAGDTTQSVSTNAVGTYTDDAKAAIQTMLGVPGDVQVNGTSVVSNGVANIPVASSSNLGVVKINSNLGITYYPSTEYLSIQAATTEYIKTGTTSLYPIAPNTAHSVAFYGLAKAAGDTTQSASSNKVGTYTTEAKAAIHTMLGIDPASIAAQVDIPLVETVSGTTPTITGQPNVRYVCGEVSTISITPPASGSVDVIFESGSTATTMTVPSTVKWPAWFDAETLEANTTYEVLITDGIYGSVMTWAT